MIKTSRQLKDKIKNLTHGDSLKSQTLLRTYMMERFLERLAVSQYNSHFVLKGGMLVSSMVGIHQRATMDIDLLAQRIPNDAEKMKKVFNDIFSIECDDALRFDLNTLEVTNITEFKEYHGVNVSITGYLDRTKVPVLSVRIHLNDVAVITADCILIAKL